MFLRARQKAPPKQCNANHIYSQLLARRIKLPGMLLLEQHMLKTVETETRSFLTCRFHELVSNFAMENIRFVGFSGLNIQLAHKFEKTGVELSKDYKTKILQAVKINQGSSR